MKYRYLVISVWIFFLAGCIGIIGTFKKESGFQTDMVACNDVCKKIESELMPYFEKQKDTESIGKEKIAQKTEQKIRQLEQEYDVEIVLIKEDRYMEQFFNATKEKKVIFELYTDETIAGKVFFSDELKKKEEAQRQMIEKIFFFLCAIAVILSVLLLFFYINYVYPFQKLEKFSAFLAKGQFDIPLKMPKQNYFGAFTESFDIMREELRKARQGEYEANRSKKELVAGLSHDIKTPVSTIEALCEILEIQIKEDTVREKIQTIQKKAQVIDSLITDMFHATLEELQVLKTQTKEEYSTQIPPMFHEMNHYGKITFQGEIPKCLIYMDKLRMNQVIDNIINNSYKYANTEITVSFLEVTAVREKTNVIKKRAGEGNSNEQVLMPEGICIRIRDYGSGVKEEELSLLTEKFYRGENSSGQTGSGLGLYLSEQFMKNMGGDMVCYNDGGFVVELFLRKV